jgi:predicted MPP superfamily phosphohydrolase
MAKINRRDFLKVSGAAVTSGVVAFSGFVSFNNEVNKPVVVAVSIPVKGLHPGLEGFTIAQLSDIHLWPYTQPELVQKGVEMANEQKPNLTVVTGDHVWRDAEASFELSEILSGLDATYGVYSVMGNHDYWMGIDTVQAGFDAGRMPVLYNQGLTIEHQGGQLYLAGMDDGWAGQADLQSALEKAPPGAPVVLLLHEPDLADQVSLDERVTLQLAGHTHGGQVRLPGDKPFALPYLGRKYERGLYQVNQMWLYTNVGLGVISVPIRYHCPPEITLFTLVGA